jgi:hypothetical protein
MQQIGSVVKNYSTQDDSKNNFASTELVITYGGLRKQIMHAESMPNL